MLNLIQHRTFLAVSWYLRCAAAPGLKPAPAAPQNSLSTKSKARRQRIVLPEGEDWRVVVAASELLERDLCDFIILGQPDQVLLFRTASELRRGSQRVSLQRAGG